MESGHVKAETKLKLQQQFESLNPFELRSAMENKLKKIFRLAKKPYKNG